MTKPLQLQASRPNMPGYGILEANQGKGLLPWSWAADRLAQAQTYWLATTRPDGRPHTMPVWGVWLNDRFFFSTGSQSRKARNLATNPYCVVSVELGSDALIVEGQAAPTTDPVILQPFVEAYSSKYQWDMTDFAEPVYVVHPSVAFAFSAGTGEFQSSATRWIFKAG